MGRKLEFWSLADSDWQLGQWQPTYSQLDVLRPIDQGLTGFFWKMGSGNHELLLFATPVFIPSMGPEVKEKNGSIESDSRWYRSPSPSFNWRGVVTQVIYSVDVPDVAKLVGNPGGGVRYRWGGAEGPWASVNYGYKPINSLILRYRTILRTPEVGQRGEVTVTPAVDYHQIGGGDIGYRTKTGMVAVSLLADSPNQKIPDDNWFQQQPEKFLATTFHVERDFDVWGFAEPLGLSFQYLRVTGGKIHDSDSAGEDMGALFENRFNYTNAAAIRAETRSMLFRQRLVTGVKLLRELEQKGSVLSAEASLFPGKNWAVSVGLDVLGVDNENSVDGNFINQFRANDRYYGGLSYVF